MSLPNGHGSQGKRPHCDRPDWRKCTGRPDCGCWVCLDKAGISLPEAREPEEGRDHKQAEESLVAQLARLSTFEYDRKRKGAAKAIGITVATLDKAVAKQHGRRSPWRRCFVPPSAQQVSEAITQSGNFDLLAWLHENAVATVRAIMFQPW